MNAADQHPVSHTPTHIKSIVTGLMLIILLGALDQTIVSVSLPQMANDLGGASMLAWVVSAYLIAATVATPVYGKLGDLYGRRLLLSVAVVVFLAASVLCAAAQNMPMLILARVVQGIGGGGLISVAQAIIGEVVPLRERGRYQSYVSATYAIASVGGPVLGGYLTELLSWRWIFWINLPIGVAALWIARRSLKGLSVPGIKRPIDYWGIVLLTAGLSLSLIGITRMREGGSFASSSFVSSASLWLILAAVISVAIFAKLEHHVAEPLIPPSIFKLRTVWITCTLLFANFFQIIALTMLVPYGMQLLDRIGPDKAALHLIALSLAIPAGAFTGGRWMTYSGRYKPMQLIGTGLLLVAMLLLAYLGPRATVASSIALALAGLATGLTLPTSLVAVQNAVPAKDIGVATAMTALFRSMGGAVGVTTLSFILFTLMGTGAADIETGAGIGAGIAAQAAPENAVSAFRITFLCGALAALISHVLAWMIPEKSLRSAERTAASK